MGVLALKLWHLMVMVAPRGGAGGGAAPPAHDTWQVHFEALQRDGIRNLDFPRAMRGIVLPAVLTLSTSLAVPYVATRGLLPLLGLPAPWLRVGNLYAHLGYHLLLASWLALAKVRVLLGRLHNAIRDDKYLVGRELKNFAAEAAAAEAAAAVVAGAAVEAAAAAADAAGAADALMEVAATEGAAGGQPGAQGEVGRAHELPGPEGEEQQGLQPEAAAADAAAATAAAPSQQLAAAAGDS